MSTPGPTFVRRRLGHRLEQLRKAAGRSQVDVDLTGIVTRATLHKIEQGRQPSKWPIVQALCELYGASPEMTQGLVELAKASKGTGWFERYGDAVPRTLGLYLDAELLASRMSIYDPEIIPGTLQTPDYARAVFEGEGDFRYGSEPLDVMIEARLERQQRFWRESASRAILCVILNEAAVVREFGGRGTMSAQVNYLREIDGQGKAEIAILPWSAGGHPAVYGAYTIFEFADPQDPTVAYVDNYRGGSYLEDPSFVARMRAIQEEIHTRSVPIKEY